MTRKIKGKHERIIDYVWAYLFFYEPGEMIRSHVYCRKGKGKVMGEIDLLRRTVRPPEIHCYEIKSSNRTKLKKSAADQMTRYAEHIKASSLPGLYVGWYCTPGKNGIIVMEPIIQIGVSGLEKIIIETGEQRI